MKKLDANACTAVALLVIVAVWAGSREHSSRSTSRPTRLPERIPPSRPIIGALPVAPADAAVATSSQPRTQRALFNAAAAGDSNEIEAMLAQGVDPNGLATVGLHRLLPGRLDSDNGLGKLDVLAAPLFAAASTNQAGAARALIARGASLDSELRLADSGQSSHAILASDRDVLTAWGANTTPVIVALANGHVEVSRVLIEAGCEINRVSPIGSPLVIAAEAGKWELVPLLIERSADVNVKEKSLDSRTVLQIAAAAGEIHCVQPIVDAGARVNAKGQGFLSEERTPLDEAISHGHADVVAYLRSKGARTAKDHMLVVTVPGTYGNEELWPTVVPGKATFASELLKQLPDGSEIHPFIWASSIDHADRVAAANNLAEEIDKRSAMFESVTLVGHSHGGNICLLAAGLCKSPINTVVCLSTPHIHIATKDRPRNYFRMWTVGVHWL